MLRKAAHRLAVAVCLLALAGKARAQDGSHGSILGTVYDQTGNPVKGVKIAATSPTQIGGQKVVYSNDEGTFRIVGLIPGVFEVRATAPRLKTVLQKDVRVGINAPAEVDLVMEVETTVEEVKVVEKAPIVSTTSAAVKETYDEEFVDHLPVDIKTAAEAFIGYNVPGVVEGGHRSAYMRGGGSNQNSFQVEGFRMNGQRSTMKAMAAIEVQTAGYGAENATTPGGVVNMVTKSGSNKFEFDINGFAEDNNLEFFREPGEGDERDYFYVLNPNLSGPIVKDRLWFFVNLEGRREERREGPDPSGYFPEVAPKVYGNVRGSGKLTWQVSSRHKLVSFTNFNRRVDSNQRRGYSDYYEPEAQQTQHDFDWFQGLIWEALLSDTVFFKSQAGYQQFWQNRGPRRCFTEDAIECDLVPQIRNTYPRNVYLQNYHEHTQTVRNAFEVINTLEWFPSSRRWGEHHLKVKNTYWLENEERAESTPGDSYIQLNGTTPDRERTYFANDPRLEPARYGWFIRTSSAFKNTTSLSDSIRFTRYLTFTPGMAVTVTRAQNVTGDSPVEGVAVTPHLAVAWDATHDGRTVLRASFNQYVDTDAMRIAQFSLGSRVYQECRWDAAREAFTRDCRYGGGGSNRTFGSPCGPTGIDVDGSDCRQKLKIPKTWEYTAGAEREVVQGVGVGADLVYRLYTYPYEELETNRIWAPSGYALDPLGGYRNGRSETVTDMSTPPEARRRWVGVTGTVRKREGKLKASAAYTWSRFEGNVRSSSGNNDFGSNPGRDLYYLYGYLDQDRRHSIKATTTYNWTRWLTTGIVYRYWSGAPYQRRFRNDVEGGFNDYRAPVGYNPGGNINDPRDDRPLRLPDRQEFNLQVRVNWRALAGVDLETYADVINALALRTVTSVQTNDGPGWGQPSGRMSPFRLRLGFRYKW